jgi:hypothetical protein
LQEVVECGHDNVPYPPLGASGVLQHVDRRDRSELVNLRQRRRNGARRLGRHLLDGSILYSSSESCPLCLTACHWAHVSRLVFGATIYDVASNGFEDLQLYRELATGTEQRSLPEVSAGGTLRSQAADVLRRWADNYPEPVTPKY